MAKPSGTPSTGEALPPVTGSSDAEKQQAAGQLREVNQQIQQLAIDLTTCDEKEIPRLSRQAQRLRVAALMLREIITDVADPTTYREMTLLNKLASGAEFEEAERDEEDTAEEVRERLHAAGVNPEMAGDMVRAMRALEAIMERDGPQPPPAGDARPS